MNQENKIQPKSITLNMCCIEYMKTLPDDFFDWAICDIEYNIGASRPTKKNRKIKQDNGTYLNVKQSEYKHSDWDDKMSPPEYFIQLFRVSKKQIIFGGNYYGLGGGYLVWDKLNGESDQYGVELAWLSFTKRTDIVYYMWSGMMQGLTASKNVKNALIQIGNKKQNEKRYHETQKPVKLYDFIINEYKVKGKVFDSHLGAGNNRIANYINGNDFYACEIDESKFMEQEKRFNLFLQTENRISFPE